MKQILNRWNRRQGVKVLYFVLAGLRTRTLEGSDATVFSQQYYEYEFTPGWISYMYCTKSSMVRAYYEIRHERKAFRLAFDRAFNDPDLKK